MKRRNRSRTRAIMSSPITLVLALIIIVFAARSAAKIYARAAESSMRLSEAQANLVRLEAKKGTLEGQIANLSTREGVEASIREKYHAVEPGETVAVIINKDDVRSEEWIGLESATSTPPEEGFWRKLLSGYSLVAEWLLPKQ